MKKWFKDNWKKLVVFGGVGLVVIPTLINLAFKIDFGIELVRAEWDAGDVLSFYAVLLASILAAYGVHLSIDYSNRNYREDLRNSVLPFFSVTNLKTTSNINLLETCKTNVKESGKYGYREYKVTDYCYEIKDGDISITSGLSEKQKALLDNGGLKWVNNGCGRYLVASNHICRPLEIENVGNGAAISFRIGFNRKDIPKKNRVYANAIPIKVGEKIMVHIFSEDCGKDSANLGEYILDLYYRDIYGNEYSQTHDVNIEYSDKHHSPIISILYEEEQILRKRSDNKK